MPLRAAAFIVTLYGDAVVPRGGAVWIGTLIAVCARVGISETLVRTAVSRLVTAGQLVGQRRGRRGFYRLTSAAQGEFAAAARLIYGPPEAGGWRFVVVPEDGAESRMMALEKAGYARLRATLAMAPARGAPPEGCLSFEAEAVGAFGLLPGFAAQAWDLAPHAADYRRFLAMFSPFGGGTAGALAPEAALTLRLLLVHAWREALLRDPRLPDSALPPDWPGHAARALFGRLYRALSPAADSAIAAGFVGIEGALPPDSAALVSRRALLDLWAKTRETTPLASESGNPG